MTKMSRRKKELPQTNIAGLVRSPFAVIPAKAGIQKLLKRLDPGLRRGDVKGRFLTF